MTECNFEKCKAECCRYVSVYLDKPKTKADFDEIKWFTAHKNVNVYRDHEKQWIVEFVTPCDNLDKKNRCKVYGEHPTVCSSYDPEECTYNTQGVVWDKYRFTCPGDVDEYLMTRRMKKSLKKKKKQDKKRKARLKKNKGKKK